eukprot:5261135-Prymnesium_polylepis.1
MSDSDTQLSLQAAQCNSVWLEEHRRHASRNHQHDGHAGFIQERDQQKQKETHLSHTVAQSAKHEVASNLEFAVVPEDAPDDAEHVEQQHRDDTNADRAEVAHSVLAAVTRREIKDGLMRSVLGNHGNQFRVRLHVD